MKSDGETLSTNEGYLLIFSDRAWVGTDRDEDPILELSYRSSPTSLNLHKAFFVNNEKMHLLKVQTGSYFLTHAFFGFDQLEFSKPISFKIIPGSITYIGHFNGQVTWPKIGLLSDRRLKIENAISDAEAKLRKRFPLTAKKHPLLNQTMNVVLANEF